jgi:hypothetical protein
MRLQIRRHRALVRRLESRRVHDVRHQQGAERGHAEPPLTKLHGQRVGKDRERSVSRAERQPAPRISQSRCARKRAAAGIAARRNKRGSRTVMGRAYRRPRRRARPGGRVVPSFAVGVERGAREALRERSAATFRGVSRCRRAEPSGILRRPSAWLPAGRAKPIARAPGRVPARGVGSGAIGGVIVRPCLAATFKASARARADRSRRPPRKRAPVLQRGQPCEAPHAIHLRPAALSP